MKRVIDASVSCLLAVSIPGLFILCAHTFVYMTTASTGSPNDPSKIVSTGPAYLDPEVRVMHELVNKMRENVGSRNLFIDLKLLFLAQDHADLMLENGKLFREGDFLNRVTKSGYTIKCGGENLIKASNDASTTFKIMCNDPDSLSNLSDKDWVNVGYGVSDGYWCIIMATSNDIKKENVLPKPIETIFEKFDDPAKPHPAKAD